MELIMVAVYDSKARAYLAPLCVRQAAVAVRWFQQELTNPATDFARFPGDYTLMELGMFEDETGITIAHNAPTQIVTGLVLKAAAEAAEATR